jgi:hypothetical protein
MAVDDDNYGTEKSFERESRSSAAYYGESSVHRDGIGRRVLDSFRRDPGMHMTPKCSSGADGKVFDVESAAANTANSPLVRRLKGRHLQMIAIGGSIGNYSTMNTYAHPLMLAFSRYWIVRRLWSGARAEWTRITAHCLLLGGCNDVLYSPRTRRNGRSVPSRRVLFILLDEVSGPSLGICNGVEVSNQAVGSPPPQHD